MLILTLGRFCFCNEIIKTQVYKWSIFYLLLACLANFSFLKFYFIFKEKLVHVLDCSHSSENGILQGIQAAGAGQPGRQSTIQYPRLPCNRYFSIKKFGVYIRQIQTELTTFKGLRAAEGKCLDKLLIRWSA